MLVKLKMTKNPVTVGLHTPVAEARDKMKKEKIHRLPVVDKHDHLVGIVTEKDILYASPSPATSLDVYEISSLMSKLEVHSVMTKEKQLITVAPTTTLEDAARILADNNIGGLPVIENDILVGIITESDLFKVFVELFGARERGIRVTMLLPEKQGELASLAGAIATAGGDIVSFVNLWGENATNRYAIVKAREISEEALVAAVKPYTQEIIDIRVV